MPTETIEQFLADTSLTEEQQTEIKAQLRAHGIDPTWSIRALTDEEWATAYLFLEAPLRERLRKAQVLVRREVGWTVPDELEHELHAKDETLHDVMALGFGDKARAEFPEMVSYGLELLDACFWFRGIDPDKRFRELTGEEMQLVDKILRALGFMPSHPRD